LREPAADAVEIVFDLAERCDYQISMSMPTLLLTVGLPGCGKTTAARQFEAEHAALRLTKDEWMKALYGAENPASASDVIEGRLIAIGLRALTLGINVALDFGLLESRRTVGSAICRCPGWRVRRNVVRPDHP
jgi:predicted kinase